MITILCLHASPGLRIFPLYPLSLLSNMVIWPGSYQDYQIKKTPFQVSLYKPKEIRLAKKSLLSGTEYGPLSASRNIFREILRISCFTVWKHTASREWTSGSCTLPGLPSKYFRPHLVNRRRFQPACCFTAGKSDARRSCLQADTGVIRLQPYLRQTSLNFPKWMFFN